MRTFLASTVDIILVERKKAVSHSVLQTFEEHTALLNQMSPHGLPLFYAMWTVSTRQE
jgi:hypothetical protein